MSRFVLIADEIIAKKPELAGDREQLIMEITALDKFSAAIVAGIQSQKARIIGILAVRPAADAKLSEDILSSFAFWGISPEKFASFLEISGGVSDLAKFIALTLEQNPDTSLEREMMKTYLLARLQPEFDLLNTT